MTARIDPRRFDALFEPRGVLVAGVVQPSREVRLRRAAQPAHPGLRGRRLRDEPRGRRGARASRCSVRSTSCRRTRSSTSSSCARRRPRTRSCLRACAARGVRAAFLTSGGYGEAGDDGRAAEARLVALADELGLLLAGPNGQGIVSTPVGLCAQIVAPYPPRGAIAIASQSGNFVSSFQNYARASGVGVSRAVSAGNAASVTVPDYLEYYAVGSGDHASRSRTSRASPTGGSSSSGRGPSPHRSRWCCSRAAPRREDSARPRRTPARSRPTTACSTGCAGRRA